MDTENFQQNYEYDYLIKLLALGDSGVGKTAFIQRYTEALFMEDFTSTVGIHFNEKRLVYRNNICDGTKQERELRLRLQIWDTAGQERFRSLTTSFFRDAMGFLLMFDIAREETFFNIRDWLTQLETHAYRQNPIVVLIGNKSDLDVKREVTRDTAINFAESLGIRYVEVSVLTGENVNKTIDTVVEQIIDEMKSEAQINMISVNTGTNVAESIPKLRNFDRVDNKSYCAC